MRAVYEQSEGMTVKLIPFVPLPDSWGYCRSATSVPEQINIQTAGSSGAVVSFVTFEDAAPPASALPSLTISEKEDMSDARNFSGITHTHTTAAGDKTYFMHFIKISKLPERTRFYYRVLGPVGTAASPVFTFRSGYSSGVTKIDVWGDMGVYTWNNMGNVGQCVLYTICPPVVTISSHPRITDLRGLCHGRHRGSCDPDGRPR